MVKGLLSSSCEGRYPALLPKYFSRLSPPFSPQPLPWLSLFHLFFGSYHHSFLSDLLSPCPLHILVTVRLITLKYEYGECHFCAKAPITFRMIYKFLSPVYQLLCDLTLVCVSSLISHPFILIFVFLILNCLQCPHDSSIATELSLTYEVCSCYPFIS